MQEVFFSIIAPVYNAEAYLEECIDSVISQTFERWELLLVDDGSTDLSPSICDRYANQDNRIKAIHQSNKGAYLARLNGISRATGKYYVGLDADDMLRNNCLERLYSVISEYEVDLVSYQNTEVDDATVSQPILEPDKEYTKEEYLQAVIKNRCPSPWDKAIRMECVKRADYSEAPENQSISLDSLSIIPAICEISSAYIISEALYVYRVHDGSISHSISERKLRDIARVYEFDERLIKKYNLYNDDIEKALYVDYLKNILSRGISSYKNGQISSKELNVLCESDFYKKCKKYERLSLFSLGDYRKLKCLRHGLSRFL